ncbi:SLAM family member 9-like [Engystomops pustulosus]|uniref:SLAM family member 9-like n=1 Tax=Engystomops pustulosus TaxID=76066 RepID=UPI003AFAD362
MTDVKPRIRGDASVQVHKPALLHGSVTISYPPPQKTETVESITWKFDKTGERVSILAGTKRYHVVYASQFMDRLQTSNDLLTLTIRDLTMEDSGIYTIEVAKSNGSTEYRSFNVTVYGGDASVQVHKPAPLHGSVTISYSPPDKGETVESITWKFDKNGEWTSILGGTGKYYVVDDSQFMDRLQTSEDLFTLTIMNVTMEDSGVYTTEVVDVYGRMKYRLYNISVYEPVPHPGIEVEVKENTTDRCNVVLHCSVPSYTSHLSYLWIFSKYEDIYELNITGSTMQMSLTDRRDVEILCTVQNPAEQKSVSIKVQDICTSTGARGGRSLRLLIVKPLQCVLFLLPLIIYLTIITDGRKGPLPTWESGWDWRTQGPPV